MNIIDLEPKKVWKFFYAITKIPRPSKKEEQIIAYLLEFAKTRGLEAARDEVGNVLIKKPATQGMKDRKSVVLQSHSDMVCEKNADVEHDFDKDPIKTKIEGNWVKAEGTTLGADDGIGIAASLALLDSDDIPHGPLEVLITADEETGMSGAFGLKPNFFESKILINLDSEDDGELFIGCAGGIDTQAFFRYQKDSIPENSEALKLSVTGLNGGHSGDEIDKGLGNAVKILNRILWQAAKQFNVCIHSFEAGNLRNAIAREGFATIVLPQKNLNDFELFLAEISDKLKNEFSVTEKKLKIACEKTDMPGFVIDKETQSRLLNALYACWHGVYAFSATMENLVETSTNLASVKFLDNNRIQIETSQRSSAESAKYDIANTVGAAFRLAGAKVEHGSGYPGWQPNPDSEILKVTEQSYKQLFGENPEVKAIHAGLECGLFLEKYPGTDMISFGPTIKGAHSPDERISIDTTEKFWLLLKDVLKNVPKK